MKSIGCMDYWIAVQESIAAEAFDLNPSDMKIMIAIEC